ncbi:hypothetical protein AJ88_19490 [Mesorhizobium amorphae CCBAU 01583]|nr:hypothetical protein AJ88_19490 [Mesorhizobium amorphae CCBAU 01583]
MAGEAGVEEVGVELVGHVIGQRTNLALRRRKPMDVDDRQLCPGANHRVGPDDFLLQPVADIEDGGLFARQIGLRIVADPLGIEADRGVNGNARAKHEGHDKNDGEAQHRKHDPSPH